LIRIVTPPHHSRRHDRSRPRDPCQRPAIRRASLRLDAHVTDRRQSKSASCADPSGDRGPLQDTARGDRTRGIPGRMRRGRRINTQDGRRDLRGVSPLNARRPVAILEDCAEGKDVASPIGRPAGTLLGDMWAPCQATRPRRQPKTVESSAPLRCRRRVRAIG
jgi:hypothetical protein